MRYLAAEKLRTGARSGAPACATAREGLARGPRGDSPGEHVLRVRWLDRVTLAKKHDCVTAAPPERASARTQASSSERQRERYVLPAEQHAAISAAINTKFQDE